MLFKDVSLPSPEENILFDEVLLHLVEAGHSGEVLRFWESSRRFIVLGRISKLEEDVNLLAAKKENVPVYRRFSGGGTVVQGPGCLNFSLILAKDRDPALLDLGKSYRYILEKVIEVLKTLDVAAVFRPISDLALIDSDKKFSGNAQHRGRHYILHHGTILYDFNMDDIKKFLLMPRRVPEYRRGRSHEDFVINCPVKPGLLKKTFQEKFIISETFQQLSSLEEKTLKEFLKTKPTLVTDHK